MHKYRRTIMWVGLLLIIILIALSIYGAFIGAERAQQFFNQPPLVVYWTALAVLLIIGLAAFRRLLRVPGLLLIHAGCVLILLGGMWGSQAGHNLQKRLFGIDKVRTGRMQIYEDHTSNMVATEEKIPLFGVALEFANSLDNRIIPQNLRQQFEKEQVALSQEAIAWVSRPGSIWVIVDEPKEYFVRREGSKLKIYDLVRKANELPLAIKLNDFRIEYYEPSYLEIETADGKTQRVSAEVGQEIDLGGELGTAKITRKFQSFKMSLDDGRKVAFEDPRGAPMPALEVRITPADGEPTTHYAFSLMPGFGHTQGGPKLTYNKPANGMISDYISELQILKDNKVVAEKDIEVNHPLRFGGYHFYQSSYDDKAGQFTVLQVVSDTGLYVVYTGYWMLCLGVIWHMWLRHIFLRFKAKSA